MAEKGFKHDPEREDETGARKYRLPFALCKAKGIAIQDWWTPRDAWEALRRGGHVDDVSEEYKEFYKKKKREADKKRRQQNAERDKRKKKQLESEDDTPTKGYVHQDGKIDGVSAGSPMDFKQADSGNVNPNFSNGEKIGYRHNCQTCVATYFARRKGYDVTALPNLDNESIYRLSYDTSLAYLTPRGQHPIKKAIAPGQRKMDFLSKEVKGDGTYALEWAWKGRSSGHIVVVERNDQGALRLYDPQTNTVKEGSEGIMSYLQGTERLRLTDLTNCALDEEFCDKIMKGKKK